MNDSKKYLRQVWRCLPGNKEQKNWILDQVQAQIRDCPPDITYSELVDSIGQPEAVAAAQIESLPALQVAQSIRRDFWVKRIVIAFLTMAVITLTVATVIALIDAHKSAHGTISQKEIVIEKNITEEDTDNAP
ncbi:MAG: hypothetical protein J5496_06820 [Lachnospiraceae bacterium]|nr:hypothetical protein [Lachnospiraceae bacterium]